MKYLYVILVIIVIYYIISYLSENYSSSEHFDPSLVPVSSIVTLAKSAQKLVDGNSILTNPKNLQVGLYSAPGNFTVTGNTDLGLPNTSTTINGVTNINSDTSINSNLNVGNGIYIREGNLALNNGTINMISDGTGGLYLSQNNNINGPGTRLTTGSINVNENLTVKNKIQVGEYDNNYITSNASDGIQISSGVYKRMGILNNELIPQPGNTRISSGGLIVDKLLQVLSIRSPLLYNNKLHIKSDTDDVYIAGIKGVTIGKGPKSTFSADLNVDGNICINNSCFSYDEYIKLKMLLKLYRFDERSKGALLCSKNTPIVLIDGLITDRNQAAYPQTVGNTANGSLKSYPYIDNNNGGADNTVPRSDDKMNFVYIYPGYGFEGWYDTEFKNGNGLKPMKLENDTHLTSPEILYYNLHTGIPSTEENISLLGVNLENGPKFMFNPSDPLNFIKTDSPPKDTTSLRDTLSSYKIYKLPPPK